MSSGKNVLYTVLDIQRISDDDLGSMKRYLPEYRLRKARRYRRREDMVNCVVSYFLLGHILKKHFGEELPSTPEFNQYGKPLFGKLGIEASISHCSGGVCCAVSDKPVGADIEKVITDYQGIMGSVLSDNERLLLQISDHPERSFTEFWTMKEAYLKMKGTGLNDKMCECDITRFSKYHPRVRSVLHWQEDICIAVCSQSEIQLKTISLDELVCACGDNNKVNKYY